MENEKLKALIDAVRIKHPKVEISVVQDLFQKDLVHFSILESKKERGFGSDCNACHAFLKAYSEFVERKTFLSLRNAGKTSNGFAVHVSSALAKENAFYELIERDALLCSWLAKVPPCWISENTLFQVLGHKISEIKKKLKEKQFDFKIGFQAQTGDISTVVGMLFSPTGLIGMAIDCKAGRDIPALISSSLDGVSFWATIISNRLEETGSIFAKESISGLWEPSSHFEYHLDKSHFPDWYLAGGSEILSLEPFYANFLEHSISFQCPWELKCVQARGSNFIDYYVGPTRLDDEHIIKRMKQNFSSDLKFNSEIHPLA